jgi:hypothetical protein
LTITNGIIRGAWQGTVNPQGSFVMWNANATHFDGQIGSDGSMRALLSGPACAITFIWRKQSP